MKTNITNLQIQKYPSYKASGVDWLGEIPEHWDSIKMKHLFRDYSEKNKPDAELLSVTQNQGVVPRTWVENRMVMPSSNLETFKFIQKGDFAISLRSFEGGLEYCYHDGIISPAYTVLKSKRKIVNQFFKYLFKCYSFISELQTSVVGIREGKNISFPELSYSFLPFPSIYEQTAIASFLDNKTALIDNAIAIKQKQIELLKERRQILIHNAVTRGIGSLSGAETPNVKMKDSGVEWIGKIPEHWEVKKVKNSCYVKARVGWKGLRSDEFLELGYSYLITGTDFKNGEIDWENAYQIDQMRFDDDPFIQLKENDLLITKDGTIGKLAIVKNLNKPACLNSGIFVIRPLIKKLSTNFLFCILSSKIFTDFNDFTSYGSTIIHLYQNVFVNFSFPYPPLNEQIEIADYIDIATTKIATAISLKEKEIEKLKEYKSVLINDVVTGKVKIF